MNAHIKALLVDELDDDLRAIVANAPGTAEDAFAVQLLRYQKAQLRILAGFNENGIGTWEHRG